MSLSGMRVAVVGLGPMGRGIARVMDRADLTVLVADVSPEASRAALERIRAEAERDGQTLSSVRAVSVAEAAAGADLLIEAIVEDLDAKRTLLTLCREHGRDDLVVATNTSSLSVGALGRAFGDPARVVGMHFFNPPTRMRLVEVIRGAATSQDTVDRALAVVDAVGKTAVVCTDSPNFVVNRICRPLYYEAQLLVAEGVQPAVVDAIAQGALGHPMGPITLLDFTGLHTHLASSETALREFGDPRYRPIPRVRQLVRSGMTGKAAGRGFYDWAEESPRAAVARVTRPPQEPSKLRVGTAGPDAARLADLLPPVDDTSDVVVYACHRPPRPRDLARLAELGRTSRVVVDSADAAWRTALPDGAGWLRLHTWRAQPFAEVVDDHPAGVPAPPWMDDVLDVLGARSARVLAAPGLVADRLSACMSNEAYTVMEEGTAERRDIDSALRLGMNHPQGPLEYVDRVGVGAVLRCLRSMLDVTGDPRYRPAQLLCRHAAAEQRAGVVGR